MRNCVLSLLLLLCSASGVCQLMSVRGAVYIADDQGRKSAAFGAVIATADSRFGIVADSEGRFELAIPDTVSRLIAFYTGYDTAAAEVSKDLKQLKIVLNKPHALSETIVHSRLKTTEMSMLNTINSQNISMGELQKAACCNLSESFYTTPSIDLVFSDAISGYKQIRLLGLLGQYTLITRENISDMTGLTAVTGLTFIPGAWMESMQLTKGAGSVVNGAESFAGQLNVELKKPDAPETFFFYAYQSTQGHSELDVNYRKKLSKRLAANLMVYANSQWLKLDQNSDHFLDQPLGEQVNILNRWIYTAPKGWMVQAGVNFLYAYGTGGEWGYKPGDAQVPGYPWGYSFCTLRLADWVKIARVYNRPGTSVGLQLSNTNYNQDSKYGAREYLGLENSIYANLIYQTFIGNTNNIIKAGVSGVIDIYNEQWALVNYGRTEKMPGVFTEFTHNFTENFNVVAGLRGDYNNMYGGFATPRLHLRYAPLKRTVIRASIGRAERTADIFAENMGYMASNRQFSIVNPVPGKPYGLDPEIAWNTGANIVHKFDIGLREAVLTVDYYYTWFQSQVVADVNSPEFVNFYNLHGRSFASAFSAQFDYELIHNLNIRLAYRYYNVMTTYEGVALNTWITEEKPFVPASRAFANVGYQTRNKWKFDYTVQYVSTQRTPGVTHNHGGLTPPRPGYAPAYVQMNCQVTKVVSSSFDIYAGGENLTNFMQHDAIIDAANPYARDFDASLIWGPMMGRNVYVGARYKIK